VVRWWQFWLHDLCWQRVVKRQVASAGNWTEPYVVKKAIDPWGRPYKYHYKGSHNMLGFDVWSDGPYINTPEDDITNWDSQ